MSGIRNQAGGQANASTAPFGDLSPSKVRKLAIEARAKVEEELDNARRQNSGADK